MVRRGRGTFGGWGGAGCVGYILNFAFILAIISIQKDGLVYLKPKTHLLPNNPKTPK